MQADLATLVGSRICHDLISPIGAISNGVELIALTNGQSGEEMELIKQSVESAAARIKFFRIAYGAAGKGQMVRQSEVITILDAIASAGRLSYDWALTDDQPRDMVRCLFLLLQAVESALPLGGTITVRGGDAGITLRGTGRRVNFDQDLWASLTEPTADYPHTAAQVQFALLPDLIGQIGRQISITPENDCLTVQF